MNRELDQAIYEKFFKLAFVESSFTPWYSSDIKEAWQIVLYMRGLFSRWNKFTLALQDEVSKTLKDYPKSKVAFQDVWRLVTPEHICKAALRV